MSEHELTLDDVLDAVGRCEPATVTDVLTALALPWSARGTVRNRLYELEDQRLVICDDERPMRFALNGATP